VCHNDAQEGDVVLMCLPLWQHLDR
jgi:hypothetical protein